MAEPNQSQLAIKAARSALVDRAVFGPANLGGPPDGIAFDAYGNLWVTLVMVDQLVALTPEAAVEARRHLPRAAIEFWDIENPSEERGGRDAIIAAYARVRDEIKAKLARRFPEIYEKA